MGIDKEFQNTYWQAHEQTDEFRHRTCLDFIDQPGRVLDLGCGDGHLLAKLKARGFNKLIGLDISETAIGKVQAKGLTGQVFNFFTDKLPYEDNSFDYVVLLDVLEHLFEPVKVLQEARRVTAQYIIISVPNFNSLPARWQILFGGTSENNTPGKGHVFWFNQKVLQSLLKKDKLAVVSWQINTFWENKFLLKYLMKLLKKIWPALFALSFLVKVKKIND